MTGRNWGPRNQLYRVCQSGQPVLAGGGPATEAQRDKPCTDSRLSFIATGNDNVTTLSVRNQLFYVHSVLPHARFACPSGVGVFERLTTCVSHVPQISRRLDGAHPPMHKSTSSTLQRRIPRKTDVAQRRVGTSALRLIVSDICVRCYSLAAIHRTCMLHTISVSCDV
jgi:hypothetical protein